MMLSKFILCLNPLIYIYISHSVGWSVCRSVCRLVCWSVCQSVGLSVRRWMLGARDLWRSALFCLNFIYSIFISKSILPGNIWLIFLYCGQMHTPDSDTQKLCIHRLRIHGLCIHRLCIYRLCIHKLIYTDWYTQTDKLNKKIRNK